MESVKLDRERGQILVQVALMVVVLFAFVALALDVGHVYGGRRRMQNAADAGALAGAQEICFGGYETIAAAHTAAEAAAIEYAIDHNGAQTATVGFPDDYTVVVTAAQTLDTFVAGVIGISTANVRAEAAARCAGAQSAGGLWPLAFKQSVYTDTERIPCDEEFIVFASKDKDSGGLDCAPECCICDEDDVVDGSECDWATDCEGKCDCALIGPHMTTADRGWLLFPDPGDDRPDECKAHANCGANELACWLEEDHPGPIQIGDCIPGQPGVDASARKPIEERVGDVVSIVLYDRECGEEGDPDPLGDCPGTPYHVAQFGCVEVLAWEQSYDIPECGNANTACQAGKNLKAVRVRKVCTNTVDEEGHELYGKCISMSGQGSGNPKDWELKSVSLVQWPLADE